MDPDITAQHIRYKQKTVYVWGGYKVLNTQIMGNTDFV